jgi:V8-like Glu-specific endopeptidase
MNAKLRWALPLAVLVSFLLLLLMTTGAATKAKSQTDTGSRGATIDEAKAEKVASPSDPVSSSEEAKILKYWTKERMENAKPLKPVALGKPGGSPAAWRSLENAPRPEGPAGKIPGSLPKQGPQATSALLQSTATGTATATSYPYPYTRAALGTSYYTSYPYRTFGKVFFVENGRRSVCSGTVINSENKSVVWTAGHCVHNGRGGTYHRNWMFVPAYKNGSYPLGRWTARNLRTTSGWAGHSDFNYDLGAAVVRPAGNGRRLANYVGSLGLTWNRPYRQNWLDFGYPAERPFNGQWMYYCKAPTAKADSSMGKPASIGIGCDMTGGASGGGWTIGLSSSGGYVASVNSYKYNNMPKAIFGTYQGNAAANLFNAVRRN